MKVKDIYEKYDKTVESWSILIYDMTGNVRLGYCNRVYSFEAIPEDIRDLEVQNFRAGYESLTVKVDFEYAEYLSEKECEADDYTIVYPCERNSSRVLYRKTENGVCKYAVVDVLKAILMRNQSGR